ncbi:hypothetical protein DPMN_169425 [Dreissena polymorpha]|uniref:Uncharacterized protein n=1 Tax=Dreissena polymorpha TaxID=45954 RepID=A0A9D4IDL8_DREPO|nr:hypothetical protein DPMN_169425 [Dreissena polymorpha]
MLPLEKNAPSLVAMFLKQQKPFSNSSKNIIGTNLQTKFHDDRKINVTSRKTHVLTKFHEDWTKNVTSRREKTAPPPGGHVFSPIWPIFELVRDINKTNVLNKFHDNWAKIVTSRVFTRFLYSYKKNTAPPLLHEDWASNVTSTVFTSFELRRGINQTNVLTKFHEDWIINVASRVFTRQNVDDGRLTTDDA